MFENIIGQAAAGQLKDDILSVSLAPSMLFFGPAASGKGSTALELARVLSCENIDAAWNCPCPSCVRHRSLVHPDLAMIGSRAFAAEIEASRTAFLRDPASLAGRSLFVRSLRKLLGRFSGSVWEYESKGGKVNPLSLLQSLEEELSEFEKLCESEKAAESGGEALEKLSASLAKNAFKLEDECVGEAIPIAQVRRAAYWSRLSPSGRRKTLLIENADRMKDDARNALLKLLEEPPQSLSVILTAQRRESVMQTILSRLRPYRFNSRSAQEEQEIIRRVFRDSAAVPEDGTPDSVISRGSPGLVSAYLDSFTPQPSEKLLPLAAFFVAAVTRSAVVCGRRGGLKEISPGLSTLGSYCARIAENSGLGRGEDAAGTISTLVSQTSGFEGRSFPRFLLLNLQLVSQALAHCDSGTDRIRYREIWKKRTEDARSAFVAYNQRPEMALESLFFHLAQDMAG